MGKGEVVSEKLKPKANGRTGAKKKAEVEENTEAVTDTKGEQPDGVTEMEEDTISEKGSRKRPRSRSSARKKDKVKEKEPEEEEKEHKSPTVKKTNDPTTSVKKEEQKTPSASTIERPVRERKSVNRLVASFDEDSAKEFTIEKGRGTALKDIPNVAYKLSKKKTEETFRLLHSILFGRRGKAAQVKNNMSRFSGFVWHDNEEKQMNRIKEKFDKYNKEKLVEFCDVLDVPISNASNTRKEDIVAKLIEFLMEPHATTSDLLSEKEQGKKRKRSSKTESGSSAPSKGSVKSRKKAESTSKKDAETKSASPESEDESGEEEESDNEMSEQAASEEKGSESEEESVEDKTKQKRGSAESSLKKESSAKAKTKKVTKTTSPPPKKVPAKSKGSEEKVEETDKEKQGSAKPSGKKGTSEKAKTSNVTISKKSSPPPKKVPAKSPNRSKSNDESSAKKSLSKKKEEANDESSAKKSLGKKKEEAVKKSSTPKSLKESPEKKVLKVKDNVKEETPKPTDDELNNSVCKILKEVDFNTATFTDILKLLGKQYNMDLTQKKMAIKSMIQDELTRIANADEEDEGDVEKDDKNASVKA